MRQAASTWAGQGACRHMRERATGLAAPQPSVLLL
jgi:hypothetical protein